MAVSNGSGFYIAPFSLDGAQLDLGFLESSKLSDEWLRTSSEFLKANGTAFKASWDGKLSHMRTRFTSSAGVAIATFFVGDIVVSSLLLLNGQTPEAQTAVAEMFTENLKRSVEAMSVATLPHPFSRIVSIGERPLVVVVVWPEDSITDQEYDLVRELGLHLAGAFFSVDEI